MLFMYYYHINSYSKYMYTQYEYTHRCVQQLIFSKRCPQILPL